MGGRSCRASGCVVRRLATRTLIDAFVLPRQAGRAGPNACYRDFWWVYDSVAGIYCGLGINGQMLMIHHPSNTVIAKFSTWPDRMDYGLADLTDAGLLALVRRRSSTACRRATDGRAAAATRSRPSCDSRR